VLAADRFGFQRAAPAPVGAPQEKFAYFLFALWAVVAIDFLASD
jgi:hypothetical protein